MIPRAPSPPVRAKTRADAGPRAERDEDLRAVDHPPVAVALGARDERRRDREPLPGLGQPVAAERLAAAQPRQPLRLLLLRPPLRDRLAGEPVVDGDDPAHRRVRASELLHDEAVRHRVEPHAAVLLRERTAEEADIGELGDDPAIHPFACGPTRARAERSRGRRTRAPSRGSAAARRSVRGPWDSWVRPQCPASAGARGEGRDRHRCGSRHRPRARARARARRREGRRQRPRRRALGRGARRHAGAAGRRRRSRRSAARPSANDENVADFGRRGAAGRGRRSTTSAASTSSSTTPGSCATGCS